MAKELFLNSIAGFSIIWFGMYNIYGWVCVCVTACVSVANIIKFYLVLLIIVAELKSGFCFLGVCTQSFPILARTHYVHNISLEYIGRPGPYTMYMCLYLLISSVCACTASTAKHSILTRIWFIELKRSFPFNPIHSFFACVPLNV